MKYKVDYPSLNKYCDKVAKQYKEWDTGLKAVNSAVEQLLNSNKMTGVGADNIESYFRTVHMPIMQSLSMLLFEYYGLCMSYKSDYTNRVDGDRKTFVSETELKNIKAALKKPGKSTENVYNTVAAALNSISDLAIIKAPSTNNANQARDKVILKTIDILDKLITELEDYHYGADFSGTDATISSTLAFINSQIKARNCKTDFNIYDVYSSQEFRDLIDSALASQQYIKENKDYFVSAFEEHAAWEEQLRLEREQKAVVLKVSLIVVTTVAGIVVTAATAGLAAPVVMASMTALGAGTAFVTSVANDAIDAYVEDGDLENLDTDQMLRDATKSAVIGGVTGLVGSAVSAGTTYGMEAGLSKVGLYNTTNSAITRYATGTFVGSTSKIAEGMVTRGLEETLDQAVQWDDKGVHLGRIDKDKIIEETFDSQKILEDEITGGISGAASTHKDLQTERKWAENSKLKGKDVDMDANEIYTKDQTSIHETDRREKIINKEHKIEDKYQKDYSKTHTTKAEIRKDPNDYDATFDDFPEVNSKGKPKIYSNKEQKIINEMHKSGEFDKIDEPMKSFGEKLNENAKAKDYVKAGKGGVKGAATTVEYFKDIDTPVAKDEDDYYFKQKIKEY